MSTMSRWLELRRKWMERRVNVMYIALGVLAIVVIANLRAAAFERATGKHVSAWDALFLDLRVQEQAK